MKEYTVTIRETSEMQVIVEAHSRQEAKAKVKAAWESGDYVLDAEHFQGVEFIQLKTFNKLLTNTLKVL